MLLANSRDITIPRIKHNTPTHITFNASALIVDVIFFTGVIAIRFQFNSVPNIAFKDE